MEVGGLALVYFASRFVGKGLGAALGGMIGKCSKRPWQNMSFALVPQAGIAIGLVVLLDGDETIRTRIIAAISPEDAMEVFESEEARGYNYFLD